MPSAHPPVAVTVDLVVLTVRDEELQVLLVRRGEEPHLGRWALPGGFLRPDEDLDQVTTGNFVTKVVYLPDAEYQELAVAGVETLVSTRLDPGVDPVVEADRRGSILAIIRIGNKDVFGFEMKEKEAENLEQYVMNTALIMRMFIFILLGAQVNFELMNQYLLGGVAVVVIFMLLFKERQKASMDKTVFFAIGGLTIVNAALAVML